MTEKKIIQFADYHLEEMPVKLPRSRNSIRMAAHLVPCNWTEIDAKTRKGNTHFWPNAEHIKALFLG